MNHHRHLVRAGALVAVALCAFFIIRAFLVPKSFGAFGHFRGDNLAEQAALPVTYGPPDSCAECHGDVFKAKMEGRHATVPCQTCHGPLSQHVTENGVSPMPIARSFTLCLRCHQEVEGRPKSFPKINMADHLSQLGKEESEAICLTCHHPHHPTPKK